MSLIPIMPLGVLLPHLCSQRLFLFASSLVHLLRLGCRRSSSASSLPTIFPRDLCMFLGMVLHRSMLVPCVVYFVRLRAPPPWIHADFVSLSFFLHVFLLFGCRDALRLLPSLLSSSSMDLCGFCFPRLLPLRFSCYWLS